MDKVLQYLQVQNLGELKFNQSMKEHTSMRVGGTVAAIIFPNTAQDIIQIINIANENNVAYKIMGRGSNCVFSSKDLDLLIIKIANVLDYLEIEDNYINVGAGYSFQSLAKKLSKKGFMGLEFAGGIPGSVGGAIFMNAGAHLRSISDIIVSVDYIDKAGKIVTIDNEACEFGYRSSIFQSMNYIIIGAKLKINVGDKAQIFKSMSGNLAYRKEMQPLEYPSCGSSFRNPPGDHAGKLIEECGLKGYRIGGVCVSTKHANFIINDQNGTGEDVYQLVKLIKDAVFKQTSVKLHTEMEFVEIDD